jgi:transposase
LTAAKAQQIIGADPFSGHVFIFRSKRGHYLKGLYWDGSGLCLFAKRLERNKFVWLPIVDGTLTLTPAQLALLIEAMDWRRTIAPPAPPRSCSFDRSGFSVCSSRLRPHSIKRRACLWSQPICPPIRTHCGHSP